ncbi:hypothetical protein [Rhizobium sp. NPDC090279]|uniref:hypothetical protein n=1 Tax=Rhizobium sp. NPDC090279 TaxID=3364499 RepID=UPI00383B2315
MTDDDPDRHIRCQDALQAALRELVSAATLAGWSEREVVLAIGDLADKHLRSLDANDNTDTLIAMLRRMT